MRGMAMNNIGEGAAKNPEDWTTGEEPATPAQRSYLETLSQETGGEVPENLTNLTKAEASKSIEELQQRSPRVSDGE